MWLIFIGQQALEQLLTAIVILIDSFQPANIIMSMGHQMDVNVPFFTRVTSLQDNYTINLDTTWQ